MPKTDGTLHFYVATFRELRRSGAALPGLAVATALYALGHGASAVALGLLGRALLGPAGPPAGAAALNAVLLLCYVGLVATTVKAGASVFLASAEARAGGAVGAAFRHRAAQSLLRHGARQGDPRVTAMLAVRVRELETATVRGVLRGVQAVAALLPLLGALIFLSAPLALGGALLVTPFAVALSVLRRRWRTVSERAQRAAESLHAEVDDMVRYLDLWRSYGAADRVETALARASERAVSAEARLEKIRAALSGANEVLGALLLLGALGLAQAIPGAPDLGSLVVFVALVLLAYKPLRDLADSRMWCTRGAVARAALEDMLAAKVEGGTRDLKGAASHEGRERDGKLPLAPAVPAANAESASQALPTMSLCDLQAHAYGRRAGTPHDFELTAGACLCVLGPTGSGKTTLLRCLLGLEPCQGELSYGPSVLTTRPVGPGHRPFAWVPQDAPVVTGTVLENVRLFGGGPEQARAALVQVGAAALAARAEETVGPGGTPLSGGECRQVAIARALCAGLPVLLLDEPTAGLDDVAARAVVKAISELRGARSVIVATHDRRLLECADVSLYLGAAPGNGHDQN